MAVTGIQTNTFLQQLPAALRQTIDGNSNGKIETDEIVGFLEQLLAAAKASSATYDSDTGGAVVQKSATTLLAGATDLTTTEKSPATTATGWRAFVYGNSTSGNYDGMMVAPAADVPTGYVAGPHRDQLEGFNAAKFDPSHPEGMTLKMVAGRVFEQFDVYSETAIDDVVKAFNDLGIPATKVGLDTIDFGNGEGPVDVIRNAAWLDGDKSAGMGWQWAPTTDGVSPNNFTMNGGTVPIAGTKPVTVTTGDTGATGTVDGPIETPSPAPADLFPGAVDAIDLSQVDFLNANVSNWPVTSKITDVEIGSDTITIDHTKAGDWPAMDYNGIDVEGNAWVLVNRGGQWYAATYEWLRPGQTEKGVTAEGIGENIKAEPLASWVPQPGERVGFMVSTPARDSSRTSNERSNVYMTTWPA